MNNYIRYTRFIALFVFVVIAAGGIVRMSQSGMGCPDWPKCFGMWIPPISADQLPEDFESYLSKQSIDHTFNAFHTWVEYINRLLGALLGIWILGHLVWTLRLRRQLPKTVVICSIFMLLCVMFTGWLGKIVVDHNLSVVKVTMHMVAALVLAILPLYIIRRIKRTKWSLHESNKGVAMFFLGLCLIQLYLGTSVREEVDLVSKGLSYINRDLWISGLGRVFSIHRSFSWTLLATSALLAYRSKFAWLELLFFFMVVSLFIMGVLFVYFGFPAIVQPIHLIVSMALITFVVVSLIPVNSIS